MKIEEIDKNFKTADLGGTPVNFYNACTAPFVIEGFAWRKDGETTFYRLPRNFTKDDVNEGALYLANNTSGGMIRFRTNSPYIAIRAKLVYSADMNHMPRAGSAGFDIYRGRHHVGTAQPSRDQAAMEQILCQNPLPGKMGDFTVNMPLYGGCADIEIGLAPGAKLLPPKAHKVKLPVLFYGSSITQGGCASRPGNMYPSHLCRAVDAPQINLGFSGSGKGEIAVAKAIASVPLAAFVMDYDHNAPNVEHLEKTHEKFFKAIRKKQPLVPIIIMSKCDIYPEFKNGTYADSCKRKAVIYKTYENAIKAGDKHVYFIDGEVLFGKSERTTCTVDRCHPNDYGFFMMYKAVLPVLKKALAEAE